MKKERKEKIIYSKRERRKYTKREKDKRKKERDRKKEKTVIARAKITHVGSVCLQIENEI